MKLNVTNTGSIQLIRRYSAGEITLGEQTLKGSFWLNAQTLRQNFRVMRPQDILENDLEDIFATNPEVVIIGWVGGQTFLSATQRGWFTERNIGVEVMELGAACRTYNVLMQDGREVLGLLFP
ncbi:MAG: hypothetical protein EXR88_03335 [Gammaproteobacteria bacterium]|nr:hypothetical protein [Gammaproteobacteria bacterium]